MILKDNTNRKRTGERCLSLGIIKPYYFRNLGVPRVHFFHSVSVYSCLLCMGIVLRSADTSHGRGPEVVNSRSAVVRGMHQVHWPSRGGLDPSPSGADKL